ncbi:hypothetical protein TCAL_09662 [Tigriopus californicus]|uniref:Spaetzle domain-containing protein n=2 Tax=Tigriopus californicus TaxID=6832 RepID=A0A553NSA5_TIGCA|nr:hypothetical protein TCAL_09662 [Tigriopus californicus]
MKFWVIVPVLCVASVWGDAEPKAEADAEAIAEAEAEAEADLRPHHAPHHPAPHGYTPAPYTPASAYGYSPGYGHEPAPYHPAPQYGPTHAPQHGAPHHAPAYPQPHHAPAYPSPHHPEPSYNPHHPEPHYAPPACSKGNHKPFCLEDPEYPTYEIQQAIEYNYDVVQQLYKDVLANTKNSVYRLKDIVEETYLCPSEVKYIQPLRAINVHGKWRIVVNHVKAHYETLTQTARVEHCAAPGSPCPLIPKCYESKCLQKHIYHRFLVYDPYDKYLPFAIESFKLASACACYNGPFHYAPH